MRLRPARWVAWLCLLLLAAAPAEAQLLSPGPLAKGHAHLEGLTNCLQCHEKGDRLSDTKCLDCHELIAERVEARRGYHGRLRGQACAGCHAEHRGRDARLVVFKPSERRFRHALTGWNLRGAHGELSCKTCHEPRRVQDKAVLDRLAKPNKARTFLGLPTRCSDCHFDEHRGQLAQEGKTDCTRCHDEQAFAPAHGFNHQTDSRYPLEGKHRDVDCAGCHPAAAAPPVPPSVFPRPVHSTAATYRPLVFARCADCHADPHEGRFGQRCERCHTVNGWHRIPSTLRDTRFHDTTAFPLVGRHGGVACAQCHGPFPGRADPGASGPPVDGGRTARRSRAQYKGLKFDRCDRCHFDAHGGQLKVALPRRSYSFLALAEDHGPLQVSAPVRPATRLAAVRDDPAAPVDCASCHGEQGFAPAGFVREDHRTARFPLEGAHRLVGCADCHRPSQPVQEAVALEAKRVAGQGRRADLASARRFRGEGEAPDCRSCHVDHHRGELQAREGATSCAACHAQDRFDDVAFDHDQTRFPLRGAHREAGCARCHPADERGVPEVAGTEGAGAEVGAGDGWPRVGAFIETSPRRYAGQPTACAACHTDAHAGQLATEGQTDCARCHDEERFVPASSFDHNDPAFTTFVLRGKHREAACGSCHPQVPVQPGADDGLLMAWYRGVPTTCVGCHVDEHDGRFEGFAP